MRSRRLLFSLIVALGAHISFNAGIWQSQAELRSETESSYFLPSGFSRILSFGYKGLLSDYLFLKIATFYGERHMLGVPLDSKDWEYFETGLDIITDLDPFFFDPYLLAEGHLAWNGRIEEANRLLEKGLQARSWDWRIPYFIGFNYFYFLQDYEKGSEYIMEAARRPWGPGFLKTLAARLAYYGGKTETAVLFLKGMLAETEDQRFRTPMEKRLRALEMAASLEGLLRRFAEEKGRPAPGLQALIDENYVDALPEDPYGGEWIILKNGRVFSTSRFADAKPPESRPE